MNKICLGCGKVLSLDKNAPGYTPNLANSLCQRCFRLKNYGEKKEEQVLSNDELIKKINKKEGIVFFLIDFLNINKETITLYKKIKLSKVLIVNKCDILRKDMKFSKIKNWLTKVYNISDAIFFSSGKNNYVNFNLLKYMENKNIKNGFIMGITNAGKSTFINNILKEYQIKKEVIVSDKTNTTLDFIKFKIQNIYLYDTPGFSYTNLNNLIMAKEIKPLSYNLKGNVTLVINEKFKFYFEKANKVTLYLNTNEVKRNYQLEDLKEEIKGIQNSDIVIPGIGFLNVKEKALIKSNLANLEVRPDMSGEEYE